jgi:penicillin-binding protein 1A
MKFQTKVFLFFLIVVPLCILAMFAVVRRMAYDLPSIENLAGYTPNLVTKVYDKDNILIAEFFTERRALVPLAEIPVNLKNAFLATEDNDFFNHWGVSLRGITRAALNVMVNRRFSQGGSTITQQLAKTIFLSPKKTITRKIKEIILTLQLEYNYTKEEILELYVNQINFGAGAYGVSAAAKVFFGKEVGDLTLAEAALLAATPKAPTHYSPFRNPENALRRRAVVLSRMRQEGYITRQQEEEALAVPLPTERHIMRKTAGHYFIEYLRIKLIEKYGQDAIYNEGLSVYTTLDLNAQIAAEQNLEESLSAFDTERKAKLEKELRSRDKELNKKKLKPEIREAKEAAIKEQVENFPKVQGAVLMLDSKTGAVRAMVGGRDFLQTQFNRAVQAKRQPGSVFKPFVYLAAIESGYTSATLLQDKPMVFVYNGTSWDLVSHDVTYLETLAESLENQLDLADTMKIWVPSNYGNKFKGPVTLRRAISSSINTCAIAVIMSVTPAQTINFARKLGITSPLTNTLSLALGASDVTLQEITSAFGVFASGGVKSEPYMVTKIVDKDGKTLEENIPQEQEVISPQVSFVMTNLLRSVVERGSGYRAKELARPAAGKTGTTNNHTDAWFIGFTPQLVCGVWVGYDDINFSLGERVTGGVLAAPIWTKIMKQTLENEPVLDFEPPQTGLEWAFIEPKTGLLALSKTPGAYLEVFLKGTAPAKYFNQADSNYVLDFTAEDEEGF